MPKDVADCPDMGRKLDTLYEVGVARSQAGDFPVSDAQTAKRLEISKTTVAAWRNGVRDRARPQGRVKTAHIKQLAAWYADLSSEHINPDEAFDLWTRADHKAFRRRLIGTVRTPLLDVLQRKPAELEIDVFVEGDGLGMIEEPLATADDEIEIVPRARIALVVPARKGRSVVVIASSADGWFWLSPGPSHDGRVTTYPEQIPRNEYWTMKAEGPCKLFVIELDASTPPFVRQRTDPLLFDPSREQVFVEELLDDQRSGTWRWGVVSLFVRGRRPAIVPGPADAIASGPEGNTAAARIQGSYPLTSGCAVPPRKRRAHELVAPPKRRA
ncbi:MAG: hypothetical protein AAGJ32_06640 [Pseudomonadota bacterium]